MGNGSIAARRLEGPKRRGRHISAAQRSARPTDHPADIALKGRRALSARLRFPRSIPAPGPGAVPRSVRCRPYTSHYPAHVAPAPPWALGRSWRSSVPMLTRPHGPSAPDFETRPQGHGRTTDSNPTHGTGRCHWNRQLSCAAPIQPRCLGRILRPRIISRKLMTTCAA